MVFNAKWRLWLHVTLDGIKIRLWEGIGLGHAYRNSMHSHATPLS
jgi:hypothetical protein